MTLSVQRCKTCNPKEKKTRGGKERSSEEGSSQVDGYKLHQMAKSRISEGSPNMSEEASGSGQDESFDRPNMVGMLPSELAENNLPRCRGYEWVSSLMTKRFSRYRWSSMVNKYVVVVPMFTLGKTSTYLFAERCTLIDNVCHGREGHDHNFIYIYPCMFTDSNICLPFNEFTMGVLCTLNVAPTQLHPNSWASLQAFQLLAKMFCLRPSPHVFLSYYSARPTSPIKWVSLVSQSHNIPFIPFSSFINISKTLFLK